MADKKPPFLVIAAGGTGGHMFPAQALAETMLRKGWRVRLTTDPRGARYTGGFPHTVEVEVLDSATFARGGLRGKLTAPFHILRGVARAVMSMWRDRPSVVVGFGGYPSIPAMAAAWICRVPRMIHEQNGVLGRVNRLFARRVDAVACGTWPTDLPKGVDGIFTGNPVRLAVMKKAAAQYICPGDYPMAMLVIGGSQGARILSDVVPGAVALLPEAIQRQLRVFHQARAEDVARVQDIYARIGVSADVEPFFNDVPRRMSEAQLVISRAGASSIADLTVIGRPSILIPLAIAIRDEQTANARPLVDAGGAAMMVEDELTALGLAQQMMEVFGNPAHAISMSDAALRLGRPDATDALADLVEMLASGQKPASDQPQNESESA